MKRSMITVCLLLLTAGPVRACIEDHDTGSGWFDQQTSRWAAYQTGANAKHQDRLMNVSLFAGGSGVLILVGVLFRATYRAASPTSSQPLSGDLPLAVPPDQPMWDPFLADADADFQHQSWSRAQTSNV
jgi:hypothetical protein